MRMAKYKVCEFGGNTVTSVADNPTDAVKNVLDGEIKVYPDGYIHVDGEPFGWVVADD